MSILLESLKQSTEDNNGDVPSVSDSHFDDEMLSDEWLLKKLKMWRFISACLLIFILVSSSFSYYYVTASKNKLSELNSQLGQVQIKNRALVLESKKIAIIKENSSSETTIPKNSITVTKKAQYQPQKQKNSYVVVSKSNASSSVESSPKLLQAERSGGNQSITPGKPTEFESLSEDEKSKLPDLEIASYAVSSNPQKSFVVLNGSFYGQGEVIAPHLELISIDKEGMVIRYKGRFIRKKYSLQ